MAKFEVYKILNITDNDIRGIYQVYVVENDEVIDINFKIISIKKYKFNNLEIFENQLFRILDKKCNGCIEINGEYYKPIKYRDRIIEEYFYELWNKIKDSQAVKVLPEENDEIVF